MIMLDYTTIQFITGTCWNFVKLGILVFMIESIYFLVTALIWFLSLSALSLDLLDLALGNTIEFIGHLG